jgi:peptidoglycan/LPS O-acetylase OafA/YrhL
MRGIAVLGVVLVHSAVSTQDKSSNYYLFSFIGQRAVELFYIVSAFTLFLARDTHRGHEHFPTSNFFIRRFFRIAPLYYVAIALNLFLHGLRPNFGSAHALSIMDVVLALLFLNAWKPNAFNSVAIGGWSVALEAMFYLMLPFLYRKITSLRSSVSLLLGLILVCPAITYLAWSRATEEYRGYFLLWLPVHLPVFCMGITGYFVVKQLRGLTMTDTERRALSMFFLILSGSVLAGCLPPSNGNFYATCFGFLLAVLSCSLQPWKFLVNPVTVFLGKISFSIYLLHFFVLQGAGRLLDRYLLVHPQMRYRPELLVPFFLFVVGVSVPISVLSWRFIEQPGIRLGRHWITHRELTAPGGRP